MIRVHVKAKDDGFLSLDVEGHANKALCASVSTVLQTNVHFLQNLEDEFPGEICVTIDQDKEDE